MSKPLQGRTIILTGAAGGIGRASAVVLAEAGAQLVLTDISEDGGQETLNDVHLANGTGIFVKADLSSEDDIKKLLSSAIDNYGQLHGAFNNAGVEQANKAIDELSLDEWQRAINIDLTSVFLCVKYEALAMLKSGGGVIVNTASSLGQVAVPNAAEYVAAKHGVMGLTRAAAADFGSRGVRVNAILPGVIRTPMIKRLSEDPTAADMFERIVARHPIGRLGEPHEIGKALKWLLSDDASFVNGAAVPVDGGYLAI